MKLEAGTFCPLIKKDCIGLKCNWFIQVRGTNPNTGKDVDEWDCSIKWLPTLLIENSQQARSGVAATESFRNEMVKASHATIATMVEIANQNVNDFNHDRPKLLQHQQDSFDGQ